MNRDILARRAEQQSVYIQVWTKTDNLGNVSLRSLNETNGSARVRTRAGAAGARDRNVHENYWVHQSLLHAAFRAYAVYFGSEQTGTNGVAQAKLAAFSQAFQSLSPCFPIACDVGAMHAICFAG